MLNVDSSIPAGSRPITVAPGYRICDGGQVWSSRRRYHDSLWRVKRPSPPDKSSGHVRIWLASGGKMGCFYVHHLVLDAFVGPCPDGMEACHNDGSPSNNFVSNLRWDTHKNNIADQKRHGTSPVGEKNPQARIKEADVIEIFRLASQGFSQSRIAKACGVSQIHVSGILRRKSWRHVEIPSAYRYPPASRHGRA